MGLACEARYFAKFQFHPMITGSPNGWVSIPFGRSPAAVHRSGGIRPEFVIHIVGIRNGLMLRYTGSLIRTRAATSRHRAWRAGGSDAKTCEDRSRRIEMDEDFNAGDKCGRC